MLSDKEKIEEAHGLWELSAARLAAFVEVGALAERVQEASRDERNAFDHWQHISSQAVSR